ncbi:hypothetical protein ACE10X_25675 [Bradyrhizobium sp. Pha-3]|uniref:hypothetical protein n=1 Tax=Bradyrhizobium sp. Pha-3 TaxID=208375 RepID=UPI0035D45587
MINLTLQVMRSFHHRRGPVLLGQAAGSHPHRMIVLSRAHDGNRSLLMTSFLIQLRRGRLDNLAYLAAAWINRVSHRAAELQFRDMQCDQRICRKVVWTNASIAKAVGADR